MTLIPQGTPVVLVNAFPLDRSQWEPLLAEPALRDAPIGDILTFDMPGLGDMPASQEEPSLELVADGAVAAMREVTGHTAALWVGCSMGGYVAMAVAQRHADAVAGLVLLGTKATADDAAARAGRLETAARMEALEHAPDPAAMAEPLVGTRGARREELLADVTRIIARQGGSGIAWGQRAMAARPDRLAVLAGLDVPAAVVWGTEDAVSSQAASEAMATALHVPLTVLDGVGHLAAFEAPAQVAPVVADVAARIPYL